MNDILVSNILSETDSSNALNYENGQNVPIGGDCEWNY